MESPAERESEMVKKKLRASVPMESPSERESEVVKKKRRASLPMESPAERKSEVLLEGILTAEDAAAVRQRDAYAGGYYDNLPKRRKTQGRCWTHGERRNMMRGDRESLVFPTIGQMHADRKAYKEMELSVALPDPKFKCGQSVLQWWVAWMKSAEETPRTYNNKMNRPAWFSAEVCSCKEYGTMKYAGQLFTEHLYIVCSWNGNGQPEVVLGQFLVEKPADARSGGLVG